MRAVLFALALTAVAFSGCSSSDDGGNNDSQSSDGPQQTGSSSRPPPGQSSTTSKPTGSQTPGPGGNNAPTGSIATSATSGGAPLNVTFTLAGSDSDGDELSWSIDADGDGTAEREVAAPATFPATFSFNYGTPGLFEVTYTVSDGQADASFTTSINVTGTGAPAGQHFEASWPGTATPVECAVGFRGETQDVNWAEMAVAPATVGHAFTATFTATGNPVCTGISWYTGDGAWIEDAGGVGAIPGSNELAGTVPDGAERALFFYVGGAQVSVVYDAE